MGLFDGLFKPDVEKLERNKDVDGLIKALGYTKDSQVGYDAAKALGKMGISAVDPLIAALRDSEWVVRRNAAKALGAIGDSKAVDPLVTALKDSHDSVRLEAAEALGAIGDPRASWPLMAALKDSNKYMRKTAILALGKIKDPRSVESLIAVALKNPDIDMRNWAGEALGKMGAPPVDSLISALRDSNYEVRGNAAETLDKIKWTCNNFELSALYWIAKLDFDKCVAIGAPAVKPLIAELMDSNGKLRVEAKDALGRIGAPAVDPLIIVLKDSDDLGRLFAARALGVIRNPRALNPLIVALTDSNDRVREDAARALSAIGDSKAVDPLIAALKDSNSSVRRNAARALGAIGDPRAVDPLVAALKDSNGGVRGDAAEALGELLDPRSFEPLFIALNMKGSDHFERRKAAQSLVKLYHSGKLGHLEQTRILEFKQNIQAKHTDRETSSDCVSHVDEGGLGVSF
jgi:HEAT repeat protein